MSIKGVIQTVWVVFNLFATGKVVLFEPYGVTFPNATTREIVQKHMDDYLFMLTHWLHGIPFSYMENLKWKIAEKKIRNISLKDQADYSDHLTQKMILEPTKITEEFVEMIMMEMQNRTMDDLQSSGIGNIAFLILNLPPSKVRDDLILLYFNKK